jgi:two-component system, OmpR family, sensor histidine kinase MprB
VAAAALEGARRDWPRTVFTADLQPGTVFGSAERLQIAVRNLLDNAAKFGPPGGPVGVSLRAGQLTVRDYGPGIGADDLPHIFDRFYRAPPARAVPGSGLGLSITRQVAESHRGTVCAERARGGGTLMRLSLPETTGLPDTTGVTEATSLPGPPAAVIAPAAGPEYLSRR